MAPGVFQIHHFGILAGEFRIYRFYFVLYVLVFLTRICLEVLSRCDMSVLVFVQRL